MPGPKRFDGLLSLRSGQPCVIQCLTLFTGGLFATVERFLRAALQLGSQILVETFDPGQFLDGARQAFEMIVTAYAEGDGRTLKQLLSKDVYENFAAAIREREKAGERMEDTLYGIDEASIVDAGMEGSTASVTVKFVSQQVNVTYDSEGRVVAGDPNEVATVTDIWTFQRNVKSRDPNWELAETRSPNEDADATSTNGADS